ncbi:MAG: hypothetical protein K9W43_04260 [Candidatus Thorarchaeota archaeon]|nr:hypothetical protein [Candidatus Thorarchaeota archaeon]
MSDNLNEQSFELGDLYINTRLPNLIEIDNIELFHGVDLSELHITFTEKKKDKSDLFKDRLKLFGLASRYMVRPFGVRFESVSESSSDDVVLRGVLPEIELFLNQLIACAGYEEIKRLSEEVFSSLELVDDKSWAVLGPLLNASVITMRNKARWLAKKPTIPVPKVKLPKDTNEFFRLIGLYQPSPVSYECVFVAVGFMDSLQMGSAVDTIIYSIEKNLFEISDRLYLIHSEYSKSNAEKMCDLFRAKKLIRERKLEVSTLLQSELESIQKVQLPTALVITPYPKDLLKGLLLFFCKVGIPSPDIYSIGAYSHPSDSKVLRVVSLLEWVGSVDDYVGAE